MTEYARTDGSPRRAQFISECGEIMIYFERDGANSIWNSSGFQIPRKLKLKKYSQRFVKDTHNGKEVLRWNGYFRRTRNACSGDKYVMYRTTGYCYLISV